jgi:polyferredoxin
MLAFFREMSVVTAIVLAVLVIGSILVKNLWCRYLCPYGALTGMVSLASPLRTRL